VARAVPLKSATPRLEDYLEAIYSLFEEKGYASTVDISDSRAIVLGRVIAWIPSSGRERREQETKK